MFQITGQYFIRFVLNPIFQALTTIKRYIYPVYRLQRSQLCILCMVKLISFNSVVYWVKCHSFIAIPTEPRGGNHTPAFAKAAISVAAHEATMVITKALALTGYRVLSDSVFFCKVKRFPSLMFLWLIYM